MGVKDILKARDAFEQRDVNPADEEEIEETDFYKCEGVRNSISRVEIYNSVHSSVGIDYTWMPVIFSLSGDEIVIPTTVHLKITITGNNLGRLKTRLMDSRVRWIKPYYGTKPPIDENDLFIEKIKIENMLFDDAVTELSLTLK